MGRRRARHTSVRQNPTQQQGARVRQLREDRAAAARRLRVARCCIAHAADQAQGGCPLGAGCLMAY
eukprot:5842910-Prymnesium_polylepis.1